MEPVVQNNVIKIKVKGSKPLEYQWLKGDRKLCDNGDYMGSTKPELEIVGTGPQVNGQYKCQVINMYGRELSQEVHYGKLSFNYQLFVVLFCFSRRSLCQGTAT